MDLAVEEAPVAVDVPEQPPQPQPQPVVATATQTLPGVAVPASTIAPTAPTLNPYAQRRQVVETTPPNAPDEQNRPAYPDVPSPTRPTKLHYCTPPDAEAMDEDGDDMLFDEEDDTPPPQPEWDEEEFFQQAAAQSELSTSNSSTNVHTSVGVVAMETHVLQLTNGVDDDEDDDDNAPSPVTKSRNQTQNDLYSFERYQENSHWRSEKQASPMRANKWKGAPQQTKDGTVAPWDDFDDDSNLGTSLSTLLAQRPAKQQPVASDALLLSMLQKHPSHGARLDRKACNMPRDPIPGKTCKPMTLGDGKRIHIPMRTESHNMGLSNLPSNGRYTSSSGSNRNVVGVSMDVLLKRVELARRKRAHETLEKAVDSRGDAVHADEMKDDDTDQIPMVKPNEQKHPALHSQLWVDKHAPSSFSHLLSDERCNREVLRALRAWDPYVFGRAAPKRPDFLQNNTFGSVDHGDKASQNASSQPKADAAKSKDKRPDEANRVILLSGPPGVGKTTLAHIVARHAGYRPVEVNGSDERTESALTDRVVRAMESSTLAYGQYDTGTRGKPNCLILDEIDGADAAKAIQALVNIIRAEIPAKGAKNKVSYLRRPIIMICNNKFAPALRALLPLARQFTVHPPSTIRLVERLRSVLSTERMSCHAGSALLNQLVKSTCGDIRSCLFTLQFVSSRAKALVATDQKGALVDVTKALQSSLNGEGMKDERNDVGDTLMTIFQKVKSDEQGKTGATPKSTDKVLAAISSFGDNSRILDCLFMNVLSVFYTDPTLDRCSAAHEWLSSSDIYRSMTSDGASGYVMEAMHIPAAAAAVHLLCRVEQRPELTMSTREMADSQFKGEANKALLQKYVEGVSLQAKNARFANQAAMDMVPYALWVLSAGEGSSALSRPTASVDLLGKGERLAFEHHAAVICSQGLSYIPDQDEVMRHKEHHLRVLPYRMEPPIERLVQFVDLAKSRLEVPSVLKQMLSRQAAHDRMQEQFGDMTIPTETGNSRPDSKLDQANVKKVLDVTTRHPEAIPEKMTAKRKAPSTNFLIAGAKQAKAARSARNAARVGCFASSSTKLKKLSNTGSGVPLTQVVRLKYVKGFTQAVSTPCRLEDLAL